MGGGLVDEDQRIDPAGAEQIEIAPDDGATHRMAHEDDPVEAELIADLAEIGGEAADAQAVIDLCRQAGRPHIDGEHAAVG